MSPLKSGRAARLLILKEPGSKIIADQKGSPRCVTNSKGKKRWAGSKNLSLALRCSDMLFVNFVSRCLE